MDSKLLAIIIALLSSAFFSSAETVFISFDKMKLIIWMEKNNVFTKTLKVFFPRQERFIITTLAGNNLAHVAFSSLAAVYLVEMGMPAPLVIAISTIIILTFGEIIPKALALHSATGIARPYSLLLWICYIVLYPIVAAFSGIYKSLFFRESESGGNSEISREALMRVVSSEAQELRRRGREIAKSALLMGDQKMREVMTPRKDVEALPIDATRDEIESLIIKTGHSKLLIYRENIDDIAGYVHVLDLLTPGKPLRELVRDAVFVSEFTPVIDGLKLLRRKKVGMLMVVDEYGGLDGIATIEDVAEELVGEIEDEYDRPQFRYKKLREGRYIISGRAEIDDLNREYHFKLDKTEGVETFGGWIVTMLGRIPETGEKFRLKNFIIKVMLSDDVSVKTVTVEYFRE